MAETGRTRWSDERIDDLALTLREEFRELRAEMREGFRDVRAEMREGVRELRGEAALNRRLLLSLWATTTLGLAGLIVETGLR